MTSTNLTALVAEYDRAQAFSLALTEGLDASQIAWRPNESSSAIGWHLGHQGAVNHYLVRNLTAAEVSFDVGFDKLFDSATPEPSRGNLPPLDEIVGYRANIASSTRKIVARIGAGEVGAPQQLAAIADGLLRAVINHEYQHAKWIGEVRSTMTENSAPSPASDRLVQVDGYWMLAAG